MSEQTRDKLLSEIEKMIEETEYDAYKDNIGTLWARLDNVNKWLLNVKSNLESL